MLKKFFLFTGCFSLIAMIACSSNESVAGGTIDPNTIAIASSSSFDEISSSSFDESSSSSSDRNSADDNGPIPEAESSSASDRYPDVEPFPDSSASFEDSFIKSRNLHIKYGTVFDGNGKNFLPVDPTAAYIQIEGDSVNVSLQNLRLDIPCDTTMLEKFVKRINSYGLATALSEDTLYVSVPLSDDMSYGCICSATIFFTLDKEYSDFGYVIFNHKDKLSVKEKTKKVDN